MNMYFATIGETSARDFENVLAPITPPTVHVLEDFRTTNQEIVELCKRLCIYKSSAIEYISTKILKEAFLTIPHACDS